MTVLDEDKFGFDFIGEYRLPLNTLILNEVNEFDVELEAKQEVRYYYLTQLFVFQIKVIWIVILRKISG